MGISDFFFFSLEICEAYFYGGLVHGVVPQAEEELQHAAAVGLQNDVRLERQTGQRGRREHWVMANPHSVHGAADQGL